MPRSGSTLLESILSMNPNIDDLGENNSYYSSIGWICEHKKIMPIILNNITDRMRPRL